MNTSNINSCLPSADSSFGPIIRASNCRSFDFTIAFEQYFFSIVPAALLIVVAPWRIYQLNKAPSLTTGTTFRLAKLVAIGIFATFQLALVGTWAAQSPELGRVRTVSLAAGCISFVASLAVGGLSWLEGGRSPRPSSVLEVYLLASLVLDAVLLRSFWLSGLGRGVCGVYTAGLGVKGVLVVLEARGGGEGGSPETTSGLYGRGLVWWMNPLLRAGWGRLLGLADLYELDEGMGSAVLSGRFWRAWEGEGSRGKYRLVLACLRALRGSLLKAVFPRLCLLGFTICQPLVLGRFLRFLQDPAEDVSVGYGLIGAYGVVYVGIAVSTAFYMHQSTRGLAMLRGTLISAIFSRATGLSTGDVDDSAAVTLMSSDVDAIIRAWREFHEIWATFIQIPVAMWLLSTHIGFACVGPLIVCGLGLLVCVLVGSSARNYMMAWMSKVQQRVGITSTMLGHIRSIKMSGLGPKLGTSIAQLRRDEIDTAAPFRRMAAIMASTAQMPLLLSPVAAFAFYTLRARETGESLDITRMFTSLSLIILLGQPLFWVFKAIMDASAALGCFKRIQDFLEKTSKAGGGTVVPTEESTAQLTSPSRDFELQELNLGTHRQTKADVAIYNATFSWTTNGTPLLHITDVEVGKGHLAIIVGPVASGKTTLLKGILGEVPSVDGHVKLGYQHVALCEQSPWLTVSAQRGSTV